jgi:putative Holliday junction resolvase
MSKILGLDYGKKRCGISITDDLRLIASPLDTINTNQIINYLVEIIARENISILVIGEPKNNKNNFFEIEESIKKLIKKIKLNIPDLIIEREDERFTSKLSKIYINQVTKKRKLRIDKRNLDKVSASLILESFLKRNK